ncbi:TPA: ABC transporter permease [Clostridioides difficile]|nr:ABC transporter permease [Clostridioides difficile]HBG6169890.1 ABC transporter permease [Clostridioides difficile]
MLKGLSFRNARRQAGKYLIYWCSLIGSVALIYAFNALIFSDVMQKLSSILNNGGSDEFSYMIIIFSFIITFILGWFVSYMMNFILKKRSREISTYMILGVDKKQIVKMLFIENLLLGASALIVGWILGIFVSKVLESIVINMFHGKYSLSPDFSLKAAGMTFLYFCIIYLIAQLKSNKKLVKMKLINLLNYDRYNENVLIHQTKTKSIMFCVSVLCGGMGIFFFSIPSGRLTDVFLGLLLIVFCLIVLFMGFGSIAQNMFEKGMNWKYKKSHLFLYRLLASKINGISIIMGIIATLFTVSIACIGIANSFYSVMNKSVDLQQFDVSIFHPNESYDFSSYEGYLSETKGVKKDYSYTLYTEEKTSFMKVRNNILSKYLKDIGRDLQYKDYTFAENQFDTFMKYSDYNILRNMLGLNPIKMDKNQFIIHCMPYLADAYKNYIGEKYKLTISDKDLSIAGIYIENFSQYGGYGNGQEYIIVIPDYLIDNMKPLYSLYVAITSEPLDSAYFTEFQKKFDTLENLNSGVVVAGNQGFVSKLRYDNKDYISGKYAMQSTGQAIILILPLFYLALIICIIGTVILSIQLLSENNIIIKHYGMLRTLGMIDSEVIKILKKHVCLYFSIPLIPAVIFGGILVSVFSYNMFNISFDAPVFFNIQIPILHAVAITLINFVVIYCIYVFITYVALRKEILHIK